MKTLSEARLILNQPYKPKYGPRAGQVLKLVPNLGDPCEGCAYKMRETSPWCEAAFHDQECTQEGNDTIYVFKLQEDA